jgi:hypothetical protein
MKLGIKDIAFLVTLATMAFFLFDGCQAKKKYEKQTIAVANYIDSVSFYKSKSGNQIAVNEALIVSSESQISGLEEELDDLKLKKPRTVIKYKTRTEIEEIEVPIEIPCEDFKLAFEVDSTYYNIKGLLTNDALNFNNISLPNEQSIYVADKREKWWKAKQYSVVVTNSNPHIASIGLESYTIEPEKEVYKKRWFWAAVGFAGGFIARNQIN